MYSFSWKESALDIFFGDFLFIMTFSVPTVMIFPQFCFIFTRCIITFGYPSQFGLRYTQIIEFQVLEGSRLKATVLDGVSSHLCEREGVFALCQEMVPSSYRMQCSDGNHKAYPNYHQHFWPMQFMLPNPEKAPSSTFLMRFSWILSSTREGGKFLGILVSRFLEK